MNKTKITIVSFVIEILLIGIFLGTATLSIYFYANQFQIKDDYELVSVDNDIKVFNYIPYKITTEAVKKTNFINGFLSFDDDSIETITLEESSLKVGECFQKNQSIGNDTYGSEKKADCIGCVLDIQKEGSQTAVVILNYNKASLKFELSNDFEIDYEKTYICKLGGKDFNCKLFELKINPSNIITGLFRIIDESFDKNFLFFNNEHCSLIVSEEIILAPSVETNIQKYLSLEEGHTYSCIIKDENEYLMVEVKILAIGDNRIALEAEAEINNKYLCVIPRTT